MELSAHGPRGPLFAAQPSETSFRRLFLWLFYGCFQMVSRRPKKGLFQAVFYGWRRRGDLSCRIKRAIKIRPFAPRFLPFGRRCAYEGPKPVPLGLVFRRTGTAFGPLSGPFLVPMLLRANVRGTNVVPLRDHLVTNSAPNTVHDACASVRVTRPRLFRVCIDKTAGFSQKPSSEACFGLQKRGFPSCRIVGVARRPRLFPVL